MADNISIQLTHCKQSPIPTITRPNVGWLDWDQHQAKLLPIRNTITHSIDDWLLDRELN